MSKVQNRKRKQERESVVFLGFGMGFGINYSLRTLSFLSTQDMSSSQQSIYYYDYGNHNQYMYYWTYAIESKESHCPQYHEYDNNRPKPVHSQIPN
jgi:hypothetical protein